MNRTVLWIAVQKQKLKLAEYILNKIKNPNQPDKTGITPLAKAVLFQDYDMVLMLIRYGADVNIGKGPSSLC